jgi:hypothetical protein
MWALDRNENKGARHLGRRRGGTGEAIPGKRKEVATGMKVRYLTLSELAISELAMEAGF